MKEAIRQYMTEMLEMEPADAEELIGMYFETLNEHCDKLSAAVAAADFAEIRRLTHSLNGCSGNVGASDIVEVVQHINSAAKEMNRAEAGFWLEKLLTLRDRAAGQA